MNRRKAKKLVKRKWNLARWPGNEEPRMVDIACTTAYVAIRAAVDIACTTAYVAIRAAVDEAFAKAIEYGETFRQVRTIPAPEGLRIGSH